MYGNRDGIAEGNTQTETINHKASDIKYYAQSYSYNEQTDRFTLVDPVGVLGSDMSEDYIGWYTLNDTDPSISKNYVQKVTEVSVSNNATVRTVYVRYGTTSREKAQTNTNDSTIKDHLDDWYKTNLLGTEYEQYLADTLFCNDRTIKDNTTFYSQLGYGVEATEYRWSSFTGSAATLHCAQQNDRFTVDDEVIGNGDLTYPIGLITVDEAHLAGGSNHNSGYYLYTGYNYWTMTPGGFHNSTIVLEVFASGSTHYGDNGDSSRGVKPVINLKPNSLASGDGTATNPYRVI